MGEMAKKISNIDNEELLKVLNEAFAEEWLAYYQYWIGAQVIEGPMRTSIQGEFMKHAKEELEHAEWLAVRIIQLGGTPILNPADWEKTASCKYLAPKIRLTSRCFGKTSIPNAARSNVISRYATCAGEKILKLSTFPAKFCTKNWTTNRTGKIFCKISRPALNMQKTSNRLTKLNNYFFIPIICGSSDLIFDK